MIPLSLVDVRRLCAGEMRVGDRAPASMAAVTGVQIDSRRVEPGDLFVAVGRGREFVDDALARGAAAALVPNDPHAALAALAALAGAIRDRTGATVVGITGSMGKTTTKDILAAICTAQRPTVAAERSYNAELGVPLTLCRIEPETELCILELAMRGFGQIAALCEIAHPHVGVVTNVGPVHLEHVGGIDGVVRAKSELLAALPAGGTAVVPAEFPVERGDLRVVRVGRDVRLERFEPPLLQTSLGSLEVSFTARHVAANAVVALTTAFALGLEIPDRLEVEFAPWRNEEVPLPGGGLLINDAWNANPVSMRAALEHLRERADGRRTLAVLGDMAELGADAVRYHREVGAAAAEAGVDVLLAVGPLAGHYLEGAAGRVPVESWWREVDVDAVVAELREQLEPGDVVLVKASRALGLEGIAAELANVVA